MPHRVIAVIHPIRGMKTKKVNTGTDLITVTMIIPGNTGRVLASPIIINHGGPHTRFQLRTRLHGVTIISGRTIRGTVVLRISDILSMDTPLHIIIRHTIILRSILTMDIHARIVHCAVVHGISVRREEAGVGEEHPRGMIYPIQIGEITICQRAQA